MRYRTLTDTGDMTPITAPSQLLTGVDAVMAAVHSRLRLLTGEWWEDPALGFRVPAYLFDGLRQTAGPALLSSYITAYIMETPGVTAVRDVQAGREGRAFRYSATVVTAYGESEGSVTEDVLLRAVS